MLKIQVLGKGMIPRGYGLAPRKEFFNADLTLIHTIMLTPGLKVNMLCPEDNKIIPVTNSNLKRLWDKYRSDKVVKKPAVVETKAPEKVEEVKPAAPAPAPAPVVETPKAPEVVTPVVTEEPKVEVVETTEPEKVEEVKTEEVASEEKKEETTTTPNGGIKPVMNNNNNNNNKGNNNNHNNHKK